MLNATIVADANIVPTVNNIPTVNVTQFTAFTGANALNLSRSTGVTTIGNVDSVVNTNITGTEALTTVNISNSLGTNTTIAARAGALSGAADTVAVNLSNMTGTFAQSSLIALNGYETLNVASTGSNTINGIFTGGSALTMNVSGGALSLLGSAGTNQQPVSNAITAFNASEMTGALSVGTISPSGGTFVGASVLRGVDNNGANKALNFTGSNSGTTVFAQSASLNTNDTLSGGSGAADTLVLTGAADVAANATQGVGNNAGAFTASGFENLRITDTNGNGVAAANVAINLTNVTGVTGVQLNGGNSANVLTLNNFVYGAPVTVTNTGNGTAGAQNVNGLNIGFTPLSVFGTTDTLNYVFGNGGTAIGTGNAVTSGALTFNGIETLSFTFNDLSVDGAVGTNGSTVGGLALTANNLTTFQVTSTGGSARTGNAINFGAAAVGGAAGTVTSALINSTAGVAIVLNNGVGASFTTAGAGNHTIAANVANAVGINGSAGTGAQTLTGNTQNDVILGGAGNDTITGGAGNDQLTAGAGANDYVFSGTTAAANGSDTITTFNVVNGDQFGITGIGLTTLANANVGTAITTASAAALATEGTSIAVGDNRYYVINQVADVATIDSVADIVTALANGGVLDAVDITQGAGNVAGLIITAVNAPTTTFIYGFTDDGAAGSVDADELALLATVTPSASVLQGATPYLTTSFV